LAEQILQIRIGGLVGNIAYIEFGVHYCYFSLAIS
jgi:hypothetical protein